MRASRTIEELEDRFWGKVPSRPIALGSCWEWGGARSRGYGMFWVPDHFIPWDGYEGRGRMHQAHRIAYWFTRGTWPDELGDDIDICHGCDNPACVRPHHLFRGTHRENMLDAKAKGRMSRQGAPAGESSPLHRLSDNDIAAIAERARAGERQGDIARDYDISQSMVSRIKTGDRRAPVSH